jgi:hypothetical protein
MQPDVMAPTIAVWPERPSDGIRVIDHALPDPQALRAEALTLPFQSIADGAATFHGIALVPHGPLAALVQQVMPGARPTLSLFRQSPAGQPEPHYVHCDRSMGDWSAILYLTPDPPADDGTVFWQRQDTAARGNDATTIEEYASDGASWFHADLWEPWYRVPAAFNRLVIFPSRLFHSRAIAENYGIGSDARLIHVCFGGDPL